MLTWLLIPSLVASAPPAPEWVVHEREDGFELFLPRAPWTAFPGSPEGTHVVVATGASQTREVGWPQLPVYHLLFAVPPGAVPRMEAWYGSTRVHALSASPVGTWSQTPDGPVLHRASQVPPHREGSPYPAEWARVEPWGQFRGVSLFALDVFPLTQVLGRSELIERKDMGVQVWWDPPGPGGTPVEPRSRKVLEAMVINPQHASTFAALPAPQAPPPWTPPAGGLKVIVPPSRVGVVWREQVASLDAGLAALPPSQLSLTWLGREVPCVVQASQGSWEALVFYSPPLPPQYAAETFTNVFWLAPGSGLAPMPSTGGQVDPSLPVVSSHPVEVTFAEELEHSGYAPSGSSLQWWWTHTQTQAVGQISVAHMAVSLGSFDRSRPLLLRLAGNAEASAPHRLKLLMAQRLLADTTWTGRGPFTVSAPVPPEVVFTGTNVLRVEAVGQSSTKDILRFKGITLSFSQGIATSDSLSFLGPSSSATCQVAGFSSGRVVVLDVTDPSGPAFVGGATVSQDSLGHRVCFPHSTPTPRRYVAVAWDQARWRCSLQAFAPQPWPEGADYVVITHPSFLSQAQRLAAHRQTEGMVTAVVDVRRLYDGFSFGYPSCLALDGFLAWAYGAWDPRPGFVVLFGDGSARQRHANATSPNFIPVFLRGGIADENAYADVDGDPRQLPDLAIGRLSVQTEDQARAFVDKIIASDRSAPSPGHARVTFFADDASGTASQPGFAYDCEQIIASVSPAYFPERIYLSYNGGSNDAWTDRPTMLRARAKGQAYYRPWILETLRAGTLLFTYVGHGGVNTFTTEWILTTEDAASLHTSPTYPLMASFSCDTGRFDDPDYDIVMAEHFTRQSEGALAFFSSTRESYPTDNSFLAVNLHRMILDRRIREIGLAIQAAKIQTDLTYVCRAYSLLGDPASRLAVPDPAGLEVSVSPQLVPVGVPVTGSITWSVPRAQTLFQLVDAFGIPLSSFQGVVSLPWRDTLAVAQALPPGTGAFRVWVAQGAQEALAHAVFTSPGMVDTAVVTPAQGSGGYVASANGNILVQVPPGCVDDTTVVRITVGPATKPPSQRAIDLCPVPGGPSGRSYGVQFDSGELGALPLDVRLAFDVNWVLPADRDSLMVGMWEDAWGVWVGLPSRVEGGRVRASAPRTGQFTVLVVYEREGPVLTGVEVEEGEWRPLQEGEYVAEGAWLRVHLVDAEGIVPSSVGVRVNQVPVEPVLQLQGLTHLQAVFPAPTGQGVHRVSVDATDIYANRGSGGFTVRIGQGLAIGSLVAVPSPFTTSTALRFVVPVDATEACAHIYTVGGRLIRTMELPSPRRGANTIWWDGRDQDGDSVAGGVYLVRLRVDWGPERAWAQTKVVKRP